MVVVNDLGGTVDGSGSSHSAADQVVDQIKEGRRVRSQLRLRRHPGGW